MIVTVSMCVCVFSCLGLVLTTVWEACVYIYRCSMFLSGENCFLCVSLNTMRPRLHCSQTQSTLHWSIWLFATYFNMYILPYITCILQVFKIDIGVIWQICHIHAVFIIYLLLLFCTYFVPLWPINCFK